MVMKGHTLKSHGMSIPLCIYQSRNGIIKFYPLTMEMEDKTCSILSWSVQHYVTWYYEARGKSFLPLWAPITAMEVHRYTC